jgi:hypothetical protein
MKTRIIFLRSNTSENDEIFRQALEQYRESISDSNPTTSGGRGGSIEERSQGFINWLHSQRIPLYLSWAHMKDIHTLKFDFKKSIPLNEIKSLKIGTKQYKNCMKLITEITIIMMKIENDNYFDFIIKGLTKLFTNVSSSFKSS